jgi:hypothetical protein
VLPAEYTDHGALGLDTLVRDRVVSPHELLDAALRAWPRPALVHTA